jgi:hypothetical protein
MYITLIGNKKDIYIDPTNCRCYIDYACADNYNKINFDGVDSLIVNRDENENLHIVQTGGWTSDRGLFVDLYN